MKWWIYQKLWYLLLTAWILLLICVIDVSGWSAVGNDGWETGYGIEIVTKRVFRLITNLKGGIF
jgi:hypothetical protein